ncbi:DNA-3-methyladenine glycosylase family protein [Brevibacillus fluminis]|uniref:DNA-3-methyladenine glycosylase family protein n=1 Tax=Brevibacillus fluminis TaxID=511487 RepID=UPI003F8CA004
MGMVATKCFRYGKKEIEFLTQADQALGEAMKRLGMVERTVIPDLFAALVHAIVGQLISAKAAQTVWERMQSRLGEITPHNLTMQPAELIQQCGITMKKALVIKEIATSIMKGTVRLQELCELSDAEVIKKLMSINGVGRWTAEMMLIHSLERPDVVSWGDVAIRRGMMKLYGLDALTRDQFEAYRRTYSPYGSVASIYLWRISFE